MAYLPCHCGEGCYYTSVSEYVFTYLPKVLVGTGIGQIKYLNRALMRFDSKVGERPSRTVSRVSRVYQRDAMKVVIPTQFVLFTLSAILGSAILYGDFRTAKFHQFMTFMYGCAATFAGVWIITWEPTSKEPSVEPHDADGAIGDVETEGLSPLSDTIPVVRVGRIPANLPVLKTRRSNLSLVGISPAQVQFCPDFFFVPDLMPLAFISSAYCYHTRHLDLKFSLGKNMGLGKESTLPVDVGEKGSRALDDDVQSAGLTMGALHTVSAAELRAE